MSAKWPAYTPASSLRHVFGSNSHTLIQMEPTNQIASRLFRSQRYVIVAILSVFAILLVITAAAGRGYVNTDSASSSLSNTYYRLWGSSSDIEVPEIEPMPELSMDEGR